MGGGNRSLVALDNWLNNFCALPLSGQASMLGESYKFLELQCWTRTWTLMFLTKGLGFPLNTTKLFEQKPIPGWASGLAIYEVNLMPYCVALGVSDVLLTVPVGRAWTTMLLLATSVSLAIALCVCMTTNRSWKGAEPALHEPDANGPT